MLLVLLLPIDEIELPAFANVASGVEINDGQVDDGRDAELQDSRIFHSAV